MSGARISDMTQTASTTALVAGAMVPVIIDGANYRYDLGAKLRTTLTPEERGAVGDATGVAGVGTNDQATIQAALDELSDDGGGMLILTRGKNYRVVLTTSVTDAGLIIPDDVTLDLNGATISLECTGGAVYGIRLKNRSAIRGPGTVAVIASTSPGSQGIWHSPISAGDALGHGGTVASPSSFHFVEGWRVKDVAVASVRADGWIGVTIYGGACRGVVDGITLADNQSTCFGAVHCDWSSVGADGAIVSSDLPTSRTNFDNNVAYTTHPNNIVIRDVRGGTMSRSEAYLVRLSGVFNILVENVEVDSINGGIFYHTAGDLGFELAPDVGHTSGKVYKPFRHKGVILRNALVRDANDDWGVFVDCYADNVQLAIDGSGYTALLDTIQRTDMVIENVNTRSDAGASTLAGFRFENIIGVKLRNCSAIGHLQGVLVEDGADEIRIEGGSYSGNRNDGIYVGNGTDKPQNIVIDGARSYQNNTAGGTRANIYLENADNVTVRNCHLGKATETAQYALRCESTVTGLSLIDNYVEAIKGGGGNPILIGTATAYGIVRECRGNYSASGVTLFDTAGVNIITETTKVGADNVARRFGRTTRATLTTEITPTAGAWVAGEQIEYHDPAAAGFRGTVCVTGGSPGTWKRYGAVEA